MTKSTFHDRVNAPIECPLKKSVIAWARCEEYRKDYQCLCKEARDRLRLKGEGREAFEQKLKEIRKAIPESPEGWKVERLTRFYMIYDEHGELAHRATNQEECASYLKLVAKAKALEDENKKLWQLLESELVDRDDPWQQLNQKLSSLPEPAFPELVDEES